MEFLNYLLISVVSYLGVIAGYILMLVAPEEKKEGMKYFNVIQHFLFLIFVLFAIFFKFSDILFILGGVLALALFYSLKRYQIHVSYLSFSVFFYLFSASTEFLIFSVIIFIYGLAAGSILFDLKDKKTSLLKVFSLAYFIIAANLLRLLF